jgi:hypothetical protein
VMVLLHHALATAFSWRPGAGRAPLAATPSVVSGSTSRCRLVTSGPHSTALALSVACSTCATMYSTCTLSRSVGNSSTTCNSGGVTPAISARCLNSAACIGNCCVHCSPSSLVAHPALYRPSHPLFLDALTTSYASVIALLFATVAFCPPVSLAFPPLLLRASAPLLLVLRGSFTCAHCHSRCCDHA